MLVAAGGDALDPRSQDHRWRIQAIPFVLGRRVAVTVWGKMRRWTCPVGPEELHGRNWTQEAMTEGARGPSGGPPGVERVAFFSDAVFAIAITLLVIEITVPAGDLTGAQLTHELGRLGPKFFSFGLSFWVIGRFWISHHLTFQYLRRWDLPMLWINLFWLACIVFLPFPTAVLGNHIALPEAARLYAATVTVTGLASTLLWWYATGRGRLVDEDLDPRLRRSMLLWALAVPVVFGLSIPLVTVRVPIGGERISLAPLLWLLLVPTVRLLVRLVFRERRRWPAGRRPPGHP